MHVEQKKGRSWLVSLRDLSKERGPSRGSSWDPKAGSVAVSAPNGSGAGSGASDFALLTDVVVGADGPRSGVAKATSWALGERIVSEFKDSS